MITDTLAGRGVGMTGVIYNDSRGGTRSMSRRRSSERNTDIAHSLCPDPAGTQWTRPGWPAQRRDSSVCRLEARPSQLQHSKRAINPGTTRGSVRSELYKLNDEWDALINQSYQTGLEGRVLFIRSPMRRDGDLAESAGGSASNASTRTDSRAHRMGR